MFGLPSPWMLLGAAIAVAAYTGTVYYAGRSAGADSVQAKWDRDVIARDRVLNERNLAAAALLQKKTEEAAAMERQLAEKNRQSEEDHARKTADLAARDARYNRLGLFYDRLKAQCGSSGGSPDGASTATPGVASDGPPEMESDALIPGQDGESVGDIIQSADQLKIDFLACADHAIELPGTINAR